MTDRELDLILIYYWPIVSRRVIASSAEDWLKGFVRTVEQQGRRSSWRPTSKQARIMRRLVDDLDASTGAELKLIET